MTDSELLNKLTVDFMTEQQKFNLEVIQRISKAEVRIYFIVTLATTVISAGISALVKVLF